MEMKVYPESLLECEFHSPESQSDDLVIDLFCFVQTHIHSSCLRNIEEVSGPSVISEDVLCAHSAILCGQCKRVTRHPGCPGPQGMPAVPIESLIETFHSPECQVWMINYIRGGQPFCLKGQTASIIGSMSHRDSIALFFNSNTAARAAIDKTQLQWCSNKTL